MRSGNGSDLHRDLCDHARRGDRRRRDCRCRQRPSNAAVLRIRRQWRGGGEHMLAGGATSTIKVPLGTVLTVTLTQDRTMTDRSTCRSPASRSATSATSVHHARSGRQGRHLGVPTRFETWRAAGSRHGPRRCPDRHAHRLRRAQHDVRVRGAVSYADEALTPQTDSRLPVRDRLYGLPA